MDLGGVDTRRYFLVVILVLVVLFALLGPEGTVKEPFWLGLFQWTVQVAVPLGFAIVCQVWLGRLRVVERLDPWLQLALGGVAAGVLFSPLALVLDLWLGVDGDAWPETAGGWRESWWDELLGVVPPVALVWVAVNAPRVLNLDFSDRSTERRGIGSGDVAAESPAPRSGFRALVPPGLGTDIVYLMSELHYLRVVTPRGSALVLYTLRDAMEELEVVDGIQPHRSYWVARAHVTDLRRTAQGWRLILSNGTRIPVSRRKQSAVKAALFPDR